MTTGSTPGSARSGLSVLVTGGSGRLGQHVVQRLRARHRPTNADRVALPGPFDLELDVLDAPAVDRACQGVDTVVHLAALDYDTHASAEDFISVNTIGTWNVLQACVRSGVRRVIVCSSVAALGLHENRPEWTPDRLPVDEHHRAQPAEPYSLSKVIVESMSESVVRAHGIDVMCVRPAAIVFPGELATFLTTVDPRARSLFDYVTVEDVAAALELAVTGDWTGFEVITLVADDSAHPAPTLEWYPEQVAPLPDDVDRDHFDRVPRASVYSNNAAKALLGWRPRSSFADLRSQAEEH